MGSRERDWKDRDWRELAERIRRDVTSWFDDDDGDDRHENAFGEGRSARSSANRQGPHRGAAPKGYVRSDKRIRDDVNDELMDEGGLDAGDISVSVSDGIVTLTGTVSSRGDKRAADDIANATRGVNDVQNRLTIQTTHTGSVG